MGGLGYQNAHAGNSCSGVGLYWANIPEFKEYLQVQLNDTLIAGRKYCASFYVNLFDSARYALSKIGMYFTETHTYIATTDYLNFTPQINNTTLITDTANWTLISGQYIANGGEQYIIIGNFFPDSLTDTVAVNPSQYFSEAYYFVDDVSVIDCTDAGVNEIEEADFKLFPNPAKNELNLSANYKVLSTKIYNVIGEVVYNTINTQTKIDISNLPRGLYFIELETDGSTGSPQVRTARRKFVKQ